MSDRNDILKDKTVDYLTALGRSAVGPIPLVGSAFSEVITNFIPGQRIDRIAKYLVALEERVTELEVNVQEKMQHPENVDLFEEGCYQACRAVTEERLNYIVNLVSNGINDNVKEYIKHKKLLSILQELNDLEISLLVIYYKKQYEDVKQLLSCNSGLRQFFLKHNTNNEDICLKQVCITKLVSLNLLDAKGYYGSKWEKIDNEQSNSEYALDEDISQLGKYFLQKLGLIDDNAQRT